MTLDDFMEHLAILEDIRERYLSKKHPEWADAAFDSARNILQDLYYFNADRYEMLVYIWGILRDVYSDDLRREMLSCQDDKEEETK